MVAADGQRRYLVTVGTTAVTLEAIPTAYDEWVAANYPSLSGGFGDDPDGDNVPSGLEWYFYNSDPTAAEGLPDLLSSVVATGPDTLTFTHRRPIDRAGLSEGYEWSRNLDNWNENGGSDGSHTVSFSIPTSGESLGEPPGYERLVITVTASPDDVDAVYARLKLSN